LSGQNILYLAEGRPFLPESVRQKLFEAREKRVHPFKDDKVLTSWNGLMIAALARAAGVFGDAEYETAAHKAADFVMTSMRSGEGGLFHRHREGEAAVTAFDEDYADSTSIVKYRDMFVKIPTPKKYPCNLCKVTHGILRIKKDMNRNLPWMTRRESPNHLLIIETKSVSLVCEKRRSKVGRSRHCSYFKLFR